MFYEVETSKSFEEASSDLEASVTRNGFGVLHVHDLGTILRSKGIDFEEECRVFEVCNPRQASRVLSVEMRMNNALPCRISVYTQDGRTKIGMIRPEKMLSMLSENETLGEVAKEVEVATVKMIDEAK